MLVIGRRNALFADIMTDKNDEKGVNFPVRKDVVRTRKATFAIFMAAIALLLSFGGTAAAHFTSTGYSDITVEAQTLKYSLIFSEHDLLQIFPADKNGDEKLSDEELSQSMDELTKLVDDGVIVTGDGKLGTGVVESAKHVKRASMDMIGIDIRYDFAAPVKRYLVQYDFFWYNGIDSAHRNYATIRFGDQTIEQVLNKENYIIQLQGTTDTSPAAETPAVPPTEPEKPAIVDTAAQPKGSWTKTLKDFTWEGMMHIWSGIDHMLFLLGLVLASNKKKWSVVKLVSAFTVGHCITLILASLELAYLSPKIVEPLIALSIVYVAVENLWKKERKSQVGVTLLFGLVHGFGFAEILRGTLSGHMALPLFSFNLGVEIGQLAVLAVIIPLLWGLSRLPIKIDWLRYGSGLVGLIGFYWFLDRIGL
ncbi:HupE/UreJ family protein [Cohnella lupini]|uniref:Hydrogenase/urease accessory protein HupE n=1 Tax=Cohnella lupini TaxID=1294267 RepID=A0A3D9HUQ9_9BACL|nr:HupE/UreJ family protein [Cohnella lupini]RED53155.1 hydrogenase/urease accessory protein HupE [Cohnella lupini]